MIHISRSLSLFANMDSRQVANTTPPVHDVGIILLHTWAEQTTDGWDAFRLFSPDSFAPT